VLIDVVRRFCCRRIRLGVCAEAAQNAVTDCLGMSELFPRNRREPKEDVEYGNDLPIVGLEVGVSGMKRWVLG
jgi:hypothetical protein